MKPFLTKLLGYALLCLAVLSLTSCPGEKDSTPGCDPTMTNDSRITYSGLYQKEVNTLLTNSKPWKTPSCLTGSDYTEPRAFSVSGCTRDAFVVAAIKFAFVAEKYWRFGKQADAESYAKLAREQLDVADGLCSNVPTACPTCDCSTKDVWVCNKSSGSGTGTGTGTGTGSTSNLTVENLTFTDLVFTLNGVTKTIGVGQKATYPGTPNSKVSYSGTTSGKTSQGTIIGLELNWSGDVTYPGASQTGNVQISVNGDYFYLRLVNKSSYTWNKLLVNYGLQAQTTDNITIPNDGKTYSIGYYKAFSNANVRVEDGNNRSWTWDSSKLGLTYNLNQSTTLTGN